jgi:hypothetical protein
VEYPFECDFEFSVFVADEGHDEGESFVAVAHEKGLFMFIAALDVASVIVQIIDFDIRGVHELWKRLSLALPVDKLNQGIGGDQ